ncbi:hydrocephalus-inducing protein-like [Photinus pyralis]|uniref:hydrocephalus-inducing protein-like n=1 Tax=Photinus pyralis TaxID=7054 RepID=UPI0012671BDE|nr:hydrocephalus-inducing protein-like [Photinus pyralis]
MSIAEQDRLPIYVTPLGGQKMQCCSIVCHGQGPVVTADTEEVDFGKVNLLTCATQALTVSNDSPIPANVSISISPKSLFSIDPKTFALNIDESKTLSISVYMTSPGTVVDKLSICVIDGNTYEVTLKAKGVGTCIESLPALAPSINFDVLMTYREFSFDVTFVNRGKKWHKLYWSRNKHLKQMRESPNELMPSAFSFCPSAIELNPDQKCTVAIKGYNTVPCYVNEDFYCHALLEKATHQEIIMSCNIIATFVEPSVELNKTEMNFVKNVGVDSVYQSLSDEIEMVNHTPLPITMNVLAKDPFYISTQDKDVTMYSVSLAPDESYGMLIKFRPYGQGNRCSTIHDALKLDYHKHPKIASFENEPLRDQ